MKKEITILKSMFGIIFALVLSFAMIPNYNVEALEDNIKDNSTMVNNYQKNQSEKGVGDSIATVFPDPEFAELVAWNAANKGLIRYVDVNEILTQEIVDNLNTLSSSFVCEVKDITGIGTLTGLRTLSLNNCEITSLPDEFDSLTNLEYFYLRGLNLDSLPPSLYNSPSISRIVIEGCSFTSIPTDLAKMPSLTVLSFRANKINLVPNEIGNIENLVYLDLSYNHITSLPESFGNLVKLEKLYLEHNQLTSLPNSFVKLNQAPLNSEVNSSSPDFDDNFLPSTIYEDLEEYGFLNFIQEGTQYERTYEQSNLELKNDIAPFTITNGEDLNNIDYINLLNYNDSYKLNSFVFGNKTTEFQISPSHNFITDGYIDENGVAIDINNYIRDGVVKKSGTVFAQVRLAGEGLFPNNSDEAVTTNRIQLNFVRNDKVLSFDLNGVDGIIPGIQNLMEGEVGTAVVDPISDGFTFIGWNTKADGSGVSWIPGTTPMGAEDVVLFAQWEKSEVSTVIENSTQPVEKISLPKTGYNINSLAISSMLLLTFSYLLIRKK